MNGNQEKVEISQQDTWELSALAEDVMHQLYTNFHAYDAEGNDIFEKHYRPGGDYEKDISPLVHREQMDTMELPENLLLYNLFRRGDGIGNMMMIFAGQTMQAASVPRYLLLQESPGTNGLDGWRGVLCLR